MDNLKAKQLKENSLYKKLRAEKAKQYCMNNISNNLITFSDYGNEKETKRAKSTFDNRSKSIDNTTLDATMIQKTRINKDIYFQNYSRPYSKNAT